MREAVRKLNGRWLGLGVQLDGCESADMIMLLCSERTVIALEILI